jgi:hypothetical protein
MPGAGRIASDSNEEVAWKVQAGIAEVGNVEIAGYNRRPHPQTDRIVEAHHVIRHRRSHATNG